MATTPRTRHKERAIPMPPRQIHAPRLHLMPVNDCEASRFVLIPVSHLPRAARIAAPSPVVRRWRALDALRVLGGVCCLVVALWLLWEVW